MNTNQQLINALAEAVAQLKSAENSADKLREDLVTEGKFGLADQATVMRDRLAKAIARLKNVTNQKPNN